MNAILKEREKDIMEVRKEVQRLQDEAAKNPEHWINDGLRKHFEEEKRKLELLKNGNK